MAQNGYVTTDSLDGIRSNIEVRQALIVYTPQALSDDKSIAKEY